MNHSKFKTANTCLFLASIISILYLPLVIAAPTSGQPNQPQAINALFNNLDVVFPASQSCGDTLSTPVTIQDYLQTTLIYLSEEKTNGSRLQAKCDKAILNNDLINFYQEIQGTMSGKIVKSLNKLPTGEVLYQCEVTFNYAAGENVWSRGVQFLIRGKTGQAINHSFRCFMTP